MPTTVAKERRQSLMSKPVQVDTSAVFDVIIVGGGTAGLALASRLSEAPDVSVLVLEAGGSSSAVEDATIPAGWRKLIFTEHDWKYFTIPQKNTNNQPQFWPRGKFLGGCSAINGMMFHHGSPDDYNQWAQLGGPGAQTWAYDQFKGYLQKLETHTPAQTGKTISDSKGKSGPFVNGHNGFVTELGHEFLDSCDAAGIRKVDDLNTQTDTLGSSFVMTAINQQGRRVSSETAYLTPEVLSRSNLKISTGCNVRRVIVEDRAGTKTAVGVEYTLSSSPSQICVVGARKDVVLSAGAIETPHIMMLSGIGPAPTLEQHGIPLVHDLPGVGASLSDHPSVILRFKCKAAMPKSLQYLTQPGGSEWNAKLAQAIEQYKTSGSGPWCSGGTEAAALFRSTDERLFPSSENPEKVQDCTTGPNAPDLELLLIPYAPPLTPGEVLPEGDYVSMAIVLLRPTSTGNITLKSSDPSEPPLIDPNHLATQNDLEVLTRGIKMALRVTKLEPLASSLDFDDTNPILDFGLFNKSHDELREIAKSRASSTFHPSCTAKMAPLKAGGVVDARLKVHGIANLRVVDTSVFPSIPSGHPMAPTIALGEKAADLMKEDLRAPEKNVGAVRRIVRHIRAMSLSRAVETPC